MMTIMTSKSVVRRYIHLLIKINPCYALQKYKWHTHRCNPKKIYQLTIVSTYLLELLVNNKQELGVTFTAVRLLTTERVDLQAGSCNCLSGHQGADTSAARSPRWRFRQIILNDVTAFYADSPGTLNHPQIKADAQHSKYTAKKFS